MDCVFLKHDHDRTVWCGQGRKPCRKNCSKHCTQAQYDRRLEEALKKIRKGAS